MGFGGDGVCVRGWGRGRGWGVGGIEWRKAREGVVCDLGNACISYRLLSDCMYSNDDFGIRIFF